MARAIPDYDEVQVRIEGSGESGYTVRAVAPDGSTDNGEFTLPFDKTQMENFVLRIGQPRRGVRGGVFGTAEMEAAKEFGSALFGAMFRGGVGDVYHDARDRADSDDKGVRITLYLSDAPDLQEIPWEFLYEAPVFLCHSIQTPVVRWIDLQRVRPPRKVELPLRILGMDSRPHGVRLLNADQERENLEQALNPLKADGLVELEWLERATLRDLQRRVDATHEFHIFHFIGHGAYDENTGTGVLLLENPDGTRHPVTGAVIGSFLYDERSLRLVVLNACEGARTSRRDPFSGVATSLVECGIPAVVGMQFEITDSAAITFADQLYVSLAGALPIDACIAQARRAIWADQHDTEFGTPVLFLGADDARLFEVKTTSVNLRRRKEPESVTPALDRPDHRQQEAPLTELAPIDGVGDPEVGDSSSGPQKQRKKWTAKTVKREKELIVFRIELDDEVHELRYEWGFFKDTLKLNGEKIRTAYVLPESGYTFALKDGNRMRSARLIVTRKGWEIGPVSLRVSGRFLYRE